MKHLLSLVPFLFTVLFLNAQDTAVAPCATPPEHSPWLQAYQQNRDAYPKSDQTLYLPMQVHVVGNDQGFGRMPVNEVFAAFCTLNEDFVEANIQFYLVDDLNFINNLEYYDHDYEAGGEMMFENNVPGVLNCYIVKNPAGACGYYWGWPDAVALRRSCVGPGDHTWAHEMGHYLSLPHTFSGWEGTDYQFQAPAPPIVNGWQVEKVNGSNCQFAGDGFCDTPPDYLSFRWNCDDNSLSTAPLLDPDSMAFNSDGNLFMSYSLDACANRFSAEQILAMRANAEFARPDLPITGTPLPPVTGTELSVLSPLAGEQILNDQPALFSWEPAPNATNYLVQFSLTEEFIFVLHEYFVSEPQLITDELRNNRTYYWRVLAYNPYQTCSGFLPASTFETTELTSTAGALPGLSSLTLSPNPAAAGTEVTLRFGLTESLDLRLRLYHPAGALLRDLPVNGLPGENRLTLPTEDLPAGMYLLGLESEQGRTVRKVIIGHKP